LDVAQRHARVKRGGDECVPERVRPDWLGDPSAAGHPAHDPGGAVPVQPPARPAEHCVDWRHRQSGARWYLQRRRLAQDAEIALAS
jgi:hypothetical protein